MLFVAQTGPRGQHLEDVADEGGLEETGVRGPPVMVHFRKQNQGATFQTAELLLPSVKRPQEVQPVTATTLTSNFTPPSPVSGSTLHDR